jgi:hypothetical protein
MFGNQNMEFSQYTNLVILYYAVVIRMFCGIEETMKDKQQIKYSDEISRS